MNSVLGYLTSSPCENPPLTAPRCGDASTDVSTVDASGGGDDPSLLPALLGGLLSSLVEPNIMRMAGRKSRPWKRPKNTVIENI